MVGRPPPSGFGGSDDLRHAALGVAGEQRPDVEGCFGYGLAEPEVIDDYVQRAGDRQPYWLVQDFRE